jgi:hypothetical protein
VDDRWELAEFEDGQAVGAGLLVKVVQTLAIVGGNYKCNSKYKCNDKYKDRDSSLRSE